MNEYKTIKNEASIEFIDHRSKFIGYIKPVKNEKEALEFLNQIKSLHRQATHNVYAYSLIENNIKRFSDDGEPQGTAGLPVLEAINDIKNIIIVVTRYFGGTLLGTGGLVRAYSQSAKLAIQSGEIIKMKYFLKTSISCNYSQYKKIESAIFKNYGIIDNTNFSDIVFLKFHIQETYLNTLKQKISEITCENKDFIIDGGDFFETK